MKISQTGIDLIKSFEGCRLTAYKPVAEEKYYTIGYGHYGPDVFYGMVINTTQAEEFLKKDLEGYERQVESTCDYLDLNQNEFDALVSFTYNCGGGGLLQLTKRKTRTKAEMMNHIEAYTKGANGKSLPGLVRRRKAEKELFLTPVEKAVEEEEMRYKNIEEIPEWGKETINKLTNRGLLKGNEKGLDLSEDMLRLLVILDRANLFN